MDDLIPSPEDKEWEKTASHANSSQAYNTDAQSRVNFPEIKGLCRTCTHAFIRRRQYSEVPVVHCTVSYDRHERVPLDIMECSRYQREGEMSLRDMHELGRIIDPRKKAGGQYL